MCVSPWPLLLLIIVTLGLEGRGAFGLRCYTDISATKSRSVECGLNTGCVKIYIDTEEMMLRRQAEYGYGYGFPPPEGVPPLPDRYLGNPILRRGCFVLAVPDRCYTAQNGLSYCWCSQKDLCNHAGFHRTPPPVSVFGLVALSLLALWRHLL